MLRGLAVESDLNELDPELVRRHAHLVEPPCGFDNNGLRVLISVGCTVSENDLRYSADPLVSKRYRLSLRAGYDIVPGILRRELTRFIGLGRGYPAGLPSICQFRRLSK